MEVSSFPYAVLDIQQLEDEFAGDGRDRNPAPAGIESARTAILDDKAEGLQLLLENNIGWLQEQGSALIHLAVQENAIKCLKVMVLGDGAPLNGTNKYNLPPLFKAVSKHWLEGVKLLLDADVDITGKYGGQPVEGRWTGTKSILQHAMTSATPEILEAILDAARGKDNYEELVNVRHCQSEMTPILMAITKGNLSFVKLLLSYRADVTLTDKQGNNVLHWAVWNGSAEIIKTLFENRPAQVSQLANRACGGTFLGTPLSLAIHCGNVDCVKILVDKVKASVVELAHDAADSAIRRPDKNYNVLHLAALCKSEAVTLFFAERLYAQLDTQLLSLVTGRTESGCTPLYFAFENRRLDFAFALLGSGADLCATDADMDVLLTYVREPAEFLNQVMTRAITRHRKQAHVTLKFTLFNPRDCCRETLEEPSQGNVTESQAVENSSVVAIEMNEAEDVRTNLISSGAASNGTVPSLLASQAGASTVTDDFTTHGHFSVPKALVKLGRTLHRNDLLEHVLVDSYLWLHWQYFRGPFALLVGMTVFFTLCLTVAPTSDFLKVPLFFSLLPLLVHEVQNLSCPRPNSYWIETGLKLGCFTMTLTWMALDFFDISSFVVFSIAVLFAYVEVAWLLLKTRHLHSSRRLMLHLIKTLMKSKDAVILVISILATAFVALEITSDFTLIECRETASIHPLVFNVLAIVSCLNFVCFALIIGYACATFDKNYYREEKVDLIVHQIEFLDVYEDFLFGRKPRYLSFDRRGIIYNVWKLLAPICPKFGRSESVKQTYVCRCGNRQDPIASDKPVEFPEDIHRAIVMKGTENRVNIGMQRKADKAAQLRDEERRRAADDSDRIKKIETGIAEMHSDLRQACKDSSNRRVLS